ncbi:DUF5615 family PIN-like protein [Janibacter anophelis]|uniref:PIN-like domain-containing protein n=1 Tax=Janibacter anophelis TaxID=319054 RepID=UPI000DEFA91C|nr:DUF5615 family PIN-like protein [Janibacter anophelis]
MRFFFDENISPRVVEPLRPIYRQHHFESMHDQQWAQLRGTDDRDLLDTLQTTFDVFVTGDKSQLKDHRPSLVESGLHWIGVRDPQAKGVRGIAALSAALLAGLPHALDHIVGLPPGEASWIVIKGVPGQASQRVSVMDVRTGQKKSA